MNNTECNELYEQLIDILNQNNLAWVVSQVADQVRLGKTVEKEIETLQESRERRAVSLFPTDEFSANLKKGPRATFPITVEYQPCERLLLLINAMEQAVVHTAEMEHHLFTHMEVEAPNLRAIQFVSEEPESQPTILERDKMTIRYESSLTLKALIEELRKEI
jgi:hypothetical protein